ncbi:hypothetical protein THAOC_25633, partial [Thalassiosira oceanica]
SAASRSVGYEQFCQPDGSLRQDAVEMLKAMAYMSLDEGREIPAHEVLLRIQCQDWDHIPPRWLELRALVNVEIVAHTLEELAAGGIVDAVRRGLPGMLAVDAVVYRKSRGVRQQEEHGVTSSKRPSVLKDRWTMYGPGGDLGLDLTRLVEHYEKAAMSGQVLSRFSLGKVEYNGGRRHLALQHFLISAKLGHTASLEKVKRLLNEGIATKADFAGALQGHAAATEEMSSPPRDEARVIG